MKQRRARLKRRGVLVFAVMLGVSLAGLGCQKDQKCYTCEKTVGGGGGWEYVDSKEACNDMMLEYLSSVGYDCRPSMSKRIMSPE